MFITIIILSDLTTNIRSTVLKKGFYEVCTRMCQIKGHKLKKNAYIYRKFRHLFLLYFIFIHNMDLPNTLVGRYKQAIKYSQYNQVVQCFAYCC